MTSTSSSPFFSSIDKLDGRDNFNSWQFSVQAYLEHESLWKCIEGTETDAVKLIKAKSKLILLIKPINYAHIQSCTTAKEIWEKLKATFEDSGLTRRVALIRTLTSTRLENCTGIEDYVNLIMNTAHKLRGINCVVDDEWIGSFLLAGLPDVYQPMIMAIESSGIPIRSDSIKTKLLQEVKSSDNILRLSNSVAYHSTHYQSNSKNSRGPRCFQCNGYGHIAANCRKKKDKENLSASTNCGSLNCSGSQTTHNCSDLSTIHSGPFNVSDLHTTHNGSGSHTIHNGSSLQVKHSNSLNGSGNGYTSGSRQGYGLFTGILSGQINNIGDSDTSVHGRKSMVNKYMVQNTDKKRREYHDVVYLDDVFTFRENLGTVTDENITSRSNVSVDSNLNSVEENNVKINLNSVQNDEVTSNFHSEEDKSENPILVESSFDDSDDGSDEHFAQDLFLKSVNGLSFNTGL